MKTYQWCSEEKGETNRHDTEREWQWIGETVCMLPSGSAQARGNSQTVNSRTPPSCMTRDRELTNPTYFRWPWILHVWLPTLSMRIPKKQWTQSSVPRLTQEPIWFSPSSASWELPVLFLQHCHSGLSQKHLGIYLKILVRFALT